MKRCQNTLLGYAHPLSHADDCFDRNSCLSSYILYTKHGNRLVSSRLTCHALPLTSPLFWYEFDFPQNVYSRDGTTGWETNGIALWTGRYRSIPPSGRNIIDMLVAHIEAQPSLYVIIDKKRVASMIQEIYKETFDELTSEWEHTLFEPIHLHRLDWHIRTMRVAAGIVSPSHDGLCAEIRELIFNAVFVYNVVKPNTVRMMYLAQIRLDYSIVYGCDVCNGDEWCSYSHTANSCFCNARKTRFDQSEIERFMTSLQEDGRPLKHLFEGGYYVHPCVAYEFHNRNLFVGRDVVMDNALLHLVDRKHKAPVEHEVHSPVHLNDVVAAYRLSVALTDVWDKREIAVADTHYNIPTEKHRFFRVGKESISYIVSLLPRPTEITDQSLALFLSNGSKMTIFKSSSDQLTCHIDSTDKSVAWVKERRASSASLAPERRTQYDKLKEKWLLLSSSRSSPQKDIPFFYETNYSAQLSKLVANTLSSCALVHLFESGNVGSSISFLRQQCNVYLNQPSTVVIAPCQSQVPVLYDQLKPCFVYHAGGSIDILLGALQIVHGKCPITFIILDAHDITSRHGESLFRRIRFKLQDDIKTARFFIGGAQHRCEYPPVSFWSSIKWECDLLRFKHSALVSKQIEKQRQGEAGIKPERDGQYNSSPRTSNSLKPPRPAMFTRNRTKKLELARRPASRAFRPSIRTLAQERGASQKRIEVDRTHGAM